MSATGTGLRCVARINAYYPTSFGLRLIGQECPELGIAPGVQAAARLPAALLGAGADVHQVLHNDHGAGLDGIDDTPAEQVIAVAPKAVDLPGQLAEMPLGRAGAFALETATQPKVPALDLLPTSFSEESVVGADGGTGKAHVHTDHLTRWLESHVRDRDDDMQPEPALAPDQIGAVKPDGLLQEVPGVGVSGERHFESSGRRGQADDALPGLDGVGAGIVADRDERGGRAGRLASLLLPRESGLYRLRRPDTRCDDQLRGEVGKPLPESVVGRMVQPDTVLLRVRPAIGGDGVETCRMLAQRFQERAGLFMIRFNTEAHGSLHIHMLPYFEKGGKR